VGGVFSVGVVWEPTATGRTLWIPLRVGVLGARLEVARRL